MQKHLYSVPQLPGVADVPLSEEAQLIITSNRAENTITIFRPDPRPEVAKEAVGIRPTLTTMPAGKSSSPMWESRQFPGRTHSPSSLSMNERYERRSPCSVGRGGQCSILRPRYCL